MRYYGAVNSAPAVTTTCDGGNGEGLICVEPADPGRRFWLLAQATADTPDDDVQDPVIMKHGWDIFLVTCVISGAIRNGMAAKSYPHITNKVSINRNNANKYAAAMFLKATKYLLAERVSKEYVENITKVMLEAEAKMAKAANDSYNWFWTKEFTGLKKDKKTKEAPTTHVKISVKKYDTDP